LGGVKIATIKDVAKTAGVSIATVSRVLNNKGPLSDKTIKKVNDAMSVLKYRPNTIARSLVKGKHYCIGIMLPSIWMPFWSQLAHELEKEATNQGYNIMITIAPDDVDSYIEKCEHLRASMLDGIITSHVRGTDEYIKNAPIPIVLIGTVDRPPSVSSNDEQGGLLATRHLIAKGCKSLIHISAKLDARKSSDERSYAFIRECDRRHISYKLYQVEERVLRNMDFSGLISSIYCDNSSFDGIFASNDILAAHCVSTALSLGYKVPEDVRIVGYDDIIISPLLYPSLTTIRHNYQRLAEAAVATLLNLIAGKEVEPKQVIPVELVERKTT